MPHINENKVELQLSGGWGVQKLVYIFGGSRERKGGGKVSSLLCVWDGITKTCHHQCGWIWGISLRE